MRFLLKMLSDMLQNPPLFLISTYVPNQKVQLGPTEISYPEPPSSVDIATARNPNQFGLTDGISVSPRWDCNLFVSLRNVSIPPR